MTDQRATGARPGTARQHLTWLAAGLVVGFVVPSLFADVLQLPRDLYYGIYLAVVLVFFVMWAQATGQRLGSMVRRRWRLAIVLGLVVGLLLSFVIIRTEPATTGPEGSALAWALLWRGVAYGAIDGLLLSAFPILAVFAAAEGTKLRRRKAGTVAVWATALLASVVMTTTYHLGYSDFRSLKLARPVAADVVWSVPTLVTLNPIGAPIAHACMHVTAVAHSYETEIFLPPHR